jgi:hypothetical protein
METFICPNNLDSFADTKTAIHIKNNHKKTVLPQNSALTEQSQNKTSIAVRLWRGEKSDYLSPVSLDC